MSVNEKTKAESVNDAKLPLASCMMYYILLTLVKTISYIPFGVLYALSDALFYPFYYIIRYRRTIVRNNLTESLPDKSVAEIIQIEKKFYHYFLDNALESCKLMTISPEEIKRRMKFTNIELANEMLAKGESVSMFLGHYGNWEWLSTIGLWLHEDAIIAQIYHKLRNKAMDKIMKEMRERMGNKCVEMYKTVRFMAGVASANKPCMLGFISDQSPKKREVKNFIQYLNHNIPVLTGSEKATKHFSYQAIFVGVRRVRRGYYECELSTLHGNPKSLPDFELTKLYFQRLENEIMQQPEYYLWSHNRFKYAR